MEVVISFLYSRIYSNFKAPIENDFFEKIFSKKITRSNYSQFSKSEKLEMKIFFKLVKKIFLFIYVIFQLLEQLSQ